MADDGLRSQAMADPVGKIEIAHRLGVQERTVHTWKYRGLLPDPDYPKVNAAPAWEWATILKWAGEQGRIRNPSLAAEYRETFKQEPAPEATSGRPRINRKQATQQPQVTSRPIGAPTVVRFGSWNCRQGLDRKRDAIDELACDVLIVPECSQTPRLADEDGVSFAWRGESRKGLGVFGFNGWRLEPMAETVPLPWCLPLLAVSPDDQHSIVVLAVWTVKSTGDGRPNYAGQFSEVLNAWGSTIATRPVVIGGDLNASLQGPSATAHRKNLDLVHALGARSAFHHHAQREHGVDDPTTLRWIGPGRVPYAYHCDYLFVSEQLIPAVTHAAIGDVPTWIESGRSDHCPITVDLSLIASPED